MCVCILFCICFFVLFVFFLFFMLRSSVVECWYYIRGRRFESYRNNIVLYFVELWCLMNMMQKLLSQQVLLISPNEITLGLLRLQNIFLWLQQIPFYFFFVVLIVLIRRNIFWLMSRSSVVERWYWIGGRGFESHRDNTQMKNIQTYGRLLWDLFVDGEWVGRNRQIFLLSETVKWEIQKILQRGC